MDVVDTKPPETGALEITPAMFAAGISVFLEYDARFESEADAGGSSELWKQPVIIG